MKFADLKNANQLMIDTIINTLEYKALIAKREAEQYKDQPSCLKGNNEPKRTH